MLRYNVLVLVVAQQARQTSERDPHMIRPAQPIALTDTETGKTTVVKTIDVTHATPAELAALLGLAQPSTTRA
jgi:hypothetical protein